MNDTSAAQAAVPRGIGLYRRGPSYDSTKPLIDQSAVHEHIAYLTQLIAKGGALYAGPFHQPDAIVSGDLIGLAVFTCEHEVARVLLAQDPAIVAGVLICEVLPWYP